MPKARNPNFVAIRNGPVIIIRRNVKYIDTLVCVCGVGGKEVLLLLRGSGVVQVISLQKQQNPSA